MTRRRSGQSGDPLKAFELQILQLKSEGLSEAEIGNQIGYSEDGVGCALTRIYQKLGLYEQEQSTGSIRYKDTRAVYLAMEQNLIQGPPPYTKAHEPLTTVEIQAASLVQFGLSYQQIGDLLGLTAKSINSRFQRIYAKLGISNRITLMVYVVFHKLDQ